MNERLDILLVKEGHAPSREKAKAIIMAGSVFVDGQREDKAGALFDADKIHIEVKGNTQKYVSRGGLKLEKAVEQFGVVLEKCVCMEKTNFRFMVPGDIKEELDFASVDVSFISLTKILLPARALLSSSGEMVCLIKPQFEAGRDKVGKKGVVRDAKIHEEVIRKIIDYSDFIGFDILHLDFSPIKGPEGNIEYLVHLRKNPEKMENTAEITEAQAEGRLRNIIEEKIGYSWEREISDLITITVDKAHGSLDL